MRLLSVVLLLFVVVVLLLLVVVVFPVVIVLSLPAVLWLLDVSPALWLLVSMSLDIVVLGVVTTGVSCAKRQEGLGTLVGWVR